MIVDKIGQANTLRKRKNNAGMADDHSFMGFVFKHFKVKLHTYYKHKKYQAYLAKKLQVAQ
jgi:hypothetical protein